MTGRFVATFSLCPRRDFLRSHLFTVPYQGAGVCFAVEPDFHQEASRTQVRLTDENICAILYSKAGQVSSFGESGARQRSTGSHPSGGMDPER